MSEVLGKNKSLEEEGIQDMEWRHLESRVKNKSNYIYLQRKRDDVDKVYKCNVIKSL
jgi:hypothetical protein